MDLKINIEKLIQTIPQGQQISVSTFPTKPVAFIYGHRIEDADDFCLSHLLLNNQVLGDIIFPPPYLPLAFLYFASSSEATGNLIQQLLKTPQDLVHPHGCQVPYLIVAKKSKVENKNLDLDLYYVSYSPELKISVKKSEKRLTVSSNEASCTHFSIPAKATPLRCKLTLEKTGYKASRKKITGYYIPAYKKFCWHFSEQDVSQDNCPCTLIESNGNYGSETRNAKNSKGQRQSKSKSKSTSENLKNRGFHDPKNQNFMLDVIMYCNASPISEDNSCAPCVEKQPVCSRTFQHSADVISLCPEIDQIKPGGFSKQVEILLSQIALQDRIVRNTNNGHLAPRIEFVHFNPAPLGIPITLVMDSSLNNAPDIANHLQNLFENEELVTWRRNIHECLCISQDQILFLKRCAIMKDQRDKDLDNIWKDHKSRLKNVHVGGKVCDLTQGQEHLIRGDYVYYHYMQDREISDKGWGCAYRSLQTLISWCQLQSYTESQTPTIPEIQSILVELGDKQKSFIGSSQWIGATEVCYVLEYVTGVSSRILHVSAGSEIESKARELARHFDTHGSPVMIGGGVLAYTLLGVKFEETTGQVRFLILDPHYIGAEDVSTIQARGWCAWKSADIFVQNAFYNFCMPIRPKLV